MSAIDLYSPWREGPRALEARNVGRERELDAIRSAARAFSRGGSPLPLYLFGANGVGKSHLLTLAIHAVEAVTPAAEVAITVVPEDAIAMRSAAMLFEVMMNGVDRQPWKSWREPLTRLHDPRRRVVLFEGLDRQLRALGIQGRRELRRLLGDGPDTWIVGAGMTLPDELTAADEAFFAAFDPWPVEALDDEEGGRLLDRVARESVHDIRWRGRRRTLLTLAGGNPRTLVALGQRERKARDRPPSEILRQVVHQFTPQHRNKLRDLSPQAQRIVTVLAAAPRELGPSELATAIDSSTTQMSVQARRLVDDGVLRRRSDGRQTWYRLSDPGFRYWLEYRNARWRQTRAGWAALLVDALYRPPALYEPASTTPSQPWRDVVRELGAAVRPLDRARAAAALTAASELERDDDALRAVVVTALVYDLGELVEALWLLALTDFPDLLAVVALDRALRTQSEAPRDAFMKFLSEIPTTANRDVVPALEHVLARSAHGRPWSLRAGERKLLAAHPFVRVLFLRQGRWWSEPPLLAPSDVVAGIERDPVDAAALLVAATDLDHPELARHAARALLRAQSALPRCTSLGVLDPETASSVAALIVAAFERDDATVQSALGWLASIADVDEPTFGAVIEALARVRAGLDDPLVQLALTKLLSHRPDRFERVAAALVHHAEQCERARLLREQLAEADDGDLHPELAVIAGALGPTRRVSP